MSKKSRYPAEFLALLAKITNRRAKIVIDHILKHGQITTEDLDQIDHRVPYEIAGEEDGGREIVDFMLLCASCQRAKSWSCEHCDNWLKARLPEICRRCYWGSPAVYDHIALKEIRRLDIVWLGDAEVAEHTRLRNLAGGARIALPLYAKAALKEHVARVSAKQQHGLTSM